MRPVKTLIGGRYQYTQSECLRTNSVYKQYRVYDKVTKRDLVLQKHGEADSFLDKMREVKHALIHQIFDIVKLQQDNQVAVLFEPGAQSSLAEALHKNHYLTENDALVAFKFALLGLKELHERLIVYERMCDENLLLCTHSIIKLGSVLYPSQVPLQTKSPEALKQEKVSYASDVYSLGVLLYRMCFGCYPFEGDNPEELLNRIKGRKYQELPTASPFKIAITRELKVLLGSMLDFNPLNRPSLQEILKVGLLSFAVDTDLQAYVKPKGNIIPEPFLRKYLVFRPSKVTYRVDDYYEQNCYLAFNIKQKQFVSLYAPDVRMFECEPRKVESFYEKLRAIKQSYTADTCGYLCKVEDYERFRREPVIITEYCNQGDLFHYLDKRKKEAGWLTQKETHIVMYILALAFKQMKDIGVTSLHTVHSQRVMIKDRNIKLRQPGLLTPFIQAKLSASNKIDFFAPELKDKSSFVELDKSDMWSYGILYYYLLQKQLPQLNSESNTININILATNKKNKNLIAKCLDQDVSRRLFLEQVQIEGVDEALLDSMVEEKRKLEEQDDLDLDTEEEEKLNQQNKRAIFKSRSRRWCKNYNKIIAESSTSACRVWIKIILGLVAVWVAFFGQFIINGGVGMLRTNFYRKIELEVLFNYATSLYNITILSTNGSAFEHEYKDYSFEQLTIDLNCTQNNHSQAARGYVFDYINYSHSAQCVFGFLFLILFSLAYGVVQYRLDLPRLMVERKERGNNQGLIHYALMFPIMCSLLFCFFSLFALEYLIQMTPCLGVTNQAYPAFTAVETLFNGNTADFLMYMLPTVVLWSTLMFLFVFLGLFNKKINARMFEYKFLIPVIVVMVLYTVICRVGFGTSVPLQPSWSYRLNTDIVSQHWGLFGLFPQVLLIPIVCLDRLIDLLFWFFLRLGMEPKDEEQIKEVEFNVKLESIAGEKLNSSDANLKMMSHDFEIFD